MSGPKTFPSDLYVGIGNALGLVLDDVKVDVYSSGASGSSLPIRSIGGPSTGLNNPFGIALDSAGNLYAANEGLATVTVYDASADGDAVPIRILSTESPRAVAIDSADNLYVLDGLGNLAQNIKVFSPGSSGNATPIRTITGIYPYAGENFGIAIDLFDNLYLSSHIPPIFVIVDPTDKVDGSIRIYPPGSDGPVSPVRTFSTGLRYPRGMDFDGANNLYVANGENVVVFDRNASDGDAPIRTITGISYGFGIAVDQDGYIYVTTFDIRHDTNLVNGHIVVYAPRAKGNATPVRTITDLDSGIGIPSGIIAINKVRKKLPIPSNPAFARVLELVGVLYGGVAADGGGVIFIAGFPIPVGPWGELTRDMSARRDVLIGLAIEQLASNVSDVAGQNGIRRAALELVNARINELLAGIQK